MKIDMKRMLGEMPGWEHLGRALSAGGYEKFDAVLQVVADGDENVPYADLFAAAKKRRGKDAPLQITLPNGTTVRRLTWQKKEVDNFAKLQTARKNISPLLALSPKKIALDIRGDIRGAAAADGVDGAGGAAESVLYAALLGAAKLPTKNAKPPPKITLAGGGLSAKKGTFIAAAAEANTAARALTLLPPNELSPAVFVQAARQLAKRHGWEFTLYSAAKLRRMGAGAFLAVGRGGPPPALVRLRYRPAKSGAKRRIALVGKGVCFDTGGVNVKPAKYMRGMGKDMAGAAAAVAALVGASRLRLPRGVDAWLALAENNISPAAYRPDEVAVAHNGKSIEIVHTDAEGRMLLADALSIATSEKYAALATLATLTGTMHIALGERMSGFFCEDAAWKARALAAAAETGERLCWFPLASDYAAALKSEVADIKQCAEEGEADHIRAALFLREFINGKAPPWLHLDLSAAACKGGLGAAPGDITGFGAALLLALLRGA